VHSLWLIVLDTASSVVVHPLRNHPERL